MTEKLEVSEALTTVESVSSVLIREYQLGGHEKRRDERVDRIIKLIKTSWATPEVDMLSTAWLLALLLSQ